MHKIEVLPRVVADLEHRVNGVGVATYGQPLTTFSDERDPLQDAYEEVLDLCLYLKRELMEKAAKVQLELPFRERIEELEAELDRLRLYDRRGA